MGDAATPESSTASLLDRERSARQRAEQNAERMQRLARIAGAVSCATTRQEVLTVIVDEAKTAIDADSGSVWLVEAGSAGADPANREVYLVDARGLKPGTHLPRYPIDTDNPLCASIRGAEEIWLESWHEFAERFPSSEARVRALSLPRPGAFCCLPLSMEGQVFGGLVFTFAEARRLDTDDRAFISMLSRHCAHGLERARLYERALEAVRVRDDFLSIAGHELRTPLATLHLQVHLLLDSLPGGPDSPTGAAVTRSLRRLLKMADELLDVSRIRAGRLRLEYEPVDLCALVREVALRTAAEQTPPREELRIEADERIDGSWDPLRLELVITNLVANACKYGGSEPIVIQVRRQLGGAEIAVCDRGEGVPLQDQSRIFERFERGVGASNFAGLGLGLWIAREITRAHGGEIRLRSAPHQGSEFTVLLPLSPPGAVA